MNTTAVRISGVTEETMMNMESEMKKSGKKMMEMKVKVCGSQRTIFIIKRRLKKIETR